MADQSARLIGTTGLTMSLAKLPTPAEGEEAPQLMVERPYGLFHTEGTLSMLQVPGQLGAQDQSAVQLLAKGGGKMILHFQDLDELDRLTRRLGGLSEAEELLEG